MKTQFKIITILVILIVFGVGCATFRAYYDVGLSQVERPAKAKVRYGDQKITKIFEEGTEKYYFEDEMVKIAWLLTTKNVSFVLTNKTNHSIKIVWDEAAFVDVSGVSHRVMHAGVKYIDRNEPQPSTVVVRKGTVSDLIIPTHNIYYISGQYGGWREASLFPFSSMSKDKLKAKAKSYIGHTIQILLPLAIEDVVNEYIFIFQISNVEIK